MRRSQLARQRGQALLIVLAFVAALLLVVWAALSLASGAFLSQGSVRADTRNTYALDAGLAYAIELEDEKNKPIACTDDLGRTLSLPYATGAITVTVDVTAIPGCKINKPSYTLQARTSSGSRILNAQISSSKSGQKGFWSITWVAYQ